jgi:hypothetical protein
MMIFLPQNPFFDINIYSEGFFLLRVPSVSSQLFLTLSEPVGFDVLLETAYNNPL